MIWYKFYLSDYISHTAHLADAEDLAYRRLLDLYYMTEKALPLDLDILSRRVRLDRDVVEPVIAEFFDEESDGYHHARCDTELSAYSSRVELNRKNGKKGGLSKRLPNAKQTLSQSEVEVEVETSISSAFASFWATWPTSPRKVGKSACEKKWKTGKLDALSKTIIDHVTSLKSSTQWTTGFEPAPLTYLNQRRWEDAPVATARRII